MPNYWLLKEDLKEFFDKFLDAEYSEQFQQSNIRVQASDLEEVFNFLKNKKDYPMDMLVDVTAVDYLTSDYAEQPNLTGREEDMYSETRFDIIYHFLIIPE